MDLRPYVDRLLRDLAVAAEAGGEDARALAGRLTAPLESSLRLILLETLSMAADEITRDLAPGSVEVRLRRGEPDFVVTRSPADHPFGEDDRAVAEPVDADVPPASASKEGGGGTARINFRLPEELKVRVEEAARQEGLSVNTWLVRAVSATFESAGRRPARRVTESGRRYTGWVG
ncbi:toxin-antitoxin system HicB family antitoxin [Nonomuraea zeae]|uniref:Toxin-antitoxin system HicB family antitoxin n=1 Tax=Nonomuraea zeae TaxID=1642303 RepID=A0A5S4GMY2_9ACTN|nr:toxin-antitoxin system HicB family antitoxin [Nonomuraea zeae]TMR34305.1 toxin-antitoxin system HicB family antitoxin [Nonomuraea zeae]